VADESAREVTMSEIDRRSALALGLSAAGGVVAISDAAIGQARPDEGQEIAPGVRRVPLGGRDMMGGRDSVLPGYKRIVMHDYVYQPGANTKSDTMPSDMVCLCPEGELRIDHRGGHPFTVKKNDVWTCVTGEPEDVENTGNTLAIMRVIRLLSA
jgi:hypothetical protein